MTVPYSFANATVSIPLSQLDANFNTPITLGNTAIQLGNTVTTLNNMTLANVTISSGNVTITNVSVTTANVTTLNAATVIATTANVTTANITTGNVTTANIVTANITTGNVTNMSSGNVAITGGSINGTTLGASTASTANVTTLTTSSTVTINGGTANGVAYLNGSKVLTTGSALTFDGTNMAIGTSPQTYATLILNGDKTALRVERGSAIGFAYNTGTAATDPFRIQSNAGPVDLYTASGQPITFSAGAAEQMRLTSTGLGIGTSSPVYKLTTNVTGGSATALFKTDQATADIYLQASGTSQTYSVGIGASANALRFMSGTLGTTMLLDSSGNLGLGVTPSAANVPTFEVGYKGSAITSTASGQMNVLGNVYYSSGWKYANTGAATLYQQDGAGKHVWYNAASGTAGNAISFTQAMTLDAGGRLLLGTTSSIDNNLTLQIDTPASSSRFIGINRNGGYGLLIGYDLGGVDYANIRTVGAYPLTFGTNNTERARITSGGDLFVGTTTGATTVDVGFRVLGNRPICTLAASTDGGATTYEVYSTGAGAYRFYVGLGGTVFATSTTISAISDQRFKENIVDLDVGLNAVMALKPRKFDWKSGKGKDIKGDRGFIAQEFEQVFPDLIDEWKDPAPEGEEPYKSVRADLIPVLVKAIQELKSELDSVKAELATLKGK